MSTTQNVRTHAGKTKTSHELKEAVRSRPAAMTNPIQMNHLREDAGKPPEVGGGEDEHRRHAHGKDEEERGSVLRELPREQWIDGFV